MDFTATADFLRGHLLGNIVPFWLKHAVDSRHGGLFTCLADDGSILSRHKYLWSQTRALWTFSALQRRIAADPRWKRVADGLFGFILAHGRDSAGRWIFVADEQGDVVEGEKSIITDAFAIMGLTEYHLLTRNPRALSAALETYEVVRSRLARPWSYPTAPYPTPPGMKAHRECMQFSLAFTELGRAAGRADILEEGRRLGREVLDHFWKPEIPALLEYIDVDNRFVDTPEGRTIVPGHGIESAYFQLLNFGSTAPPELLLRACTIIRSCLERGWDTDFGGLLLGVDALGQEPVYWRHAAMKLWWPHAEALPACLLAYEVCREDWCLDWYRRIQDYAFAHFPVPLHGEWTQRLSREGQPVDTLVALPVKDPFHLPRGLILSIETLERLAGRVPTKCAAEERRAS